jgi:exodeoxyribonuclease VII small subunit
MAEKQNDKTKNFEKSLGRLETIVGEMESGSLSLEKMMAHFEEGMELVGFCTKKLNEIERRIEVLTRKGDAETTEPYEGEENER